MKKTILLVFVLALGLAAEVANADYTFGTPTNLGPTVNSSSLEANSSISADGLELYISSNRPGRVGAMDIWVSTRDTTDDEWGTPMNLGPIFNSSVSDGSPSISADGLSLFLYSVRPGGYGDRDIWVATRETTGEDWATPVNLGSTVNSSYRDSGPSISGDGLSLYFESERPGGYGGRDIWVTRRATVSDPWDTPMNLGLTVNGRAKEAFPSISADGLSLYFNSVRPGEYGGGDLWVTTRATIYDDWGTPVNLGPTVNSSATENCPHISPDGSTLFFMSNRKWPGRVGGYDLWQAPIIPIIDFNGDGIVDSADMCILVDHWGENYSLCDVGPMPWGDGIVDVQDLIVLTEHLFEEILPVELVAYWRLDEEEGDIAYDSAGTNDAVTFGDPLWQPDAGQVNGALAFDGIDDYVSTSFILDPADAVFSVFAWIKDGAPGQVVISQNYGANWLLADPQAGALMTELKSSGGSRTPLWSQTVITDGDWHRIGLVSDGSNRILYVDDVKVASDTSDKGWLIGGLQIGAGKNLDPGSFFSGLIDDVRIYNQAITKVATQPNPADGAEGVPVDATLSWTPGLKAMTHDVYFGTSSPPAFIGNQAANSYDPGSLEFDTTYYWQVDEIEADGTAIHIGDVWSFTTTTDLSTVSEIATQPNPDDGEDRVTIDATLSWWPGASAVTHDVYFGTSSAPALIGNQEATTYYPGSLEFGTTYYWQVDEIEADSTTKHTGDIWSFTTVANTGVKKGSYLIYPGDNTQMTVLWQLDATHDCTLEWGTDPNYGSSATSSEYGSDHQHQYTITGLAPGAKYYYRVQVEAGYLIGSFLAAPAADAENVKFLAYGDTRSSPQTHDAVNAQMIATYTADPAYQTFTMLTGDWVAKGDKESHWTGAFFSRSQQNTMEMQANLPINGCIGNHEQSGTVFEKYWPYPYESGGWYWSFDYGPAHIVVLDQFTTSYAPGSPQYMWLENDLANATAPWKFVQLHAPGWSASSNGNNSAVQNYIQPLCETYGVAIVFAGHKHYYARAMVNGVAHITTGGGGAPLYDPEGGHPNIVAYDKSNHFCKIDIQGKQLTFEAVRSDGTVIDTFTMSH